jgi:dihydroorotate dehydrogenase
MEEQGGYSGPQLFHRTVNLVKMYRRILDYPLHELNEPQQVQLHTPATLSTSHRLKQSSTSDGSTQHATLTPKVIFCTGGITNGQQALEVLDAGASVAQIYTALVYGGVGKITSMKREMRHQKSLEPNDPGT